MRVLGSPASATSASASDSPSSTQLNAPHVDKIYIYLKKQNKKNGGTGEGELEYGVLHDHREYRVACGAVDDELGGGEGDRLGCYGSGALGMALIGAGIILTFQLMQTPRSRLLPPRHRRHRLPAPTMYNALGYGKGDTILAAFSIAVGWPASMGATSLPFSSGGVFIETAFKEAARELEGKFSVVSAQNFLETYLPDGPTPMPEFRSSPFRRVANQSSEKKMYEPLIEALTPFLKQGWTLANTSDTPDPDSGFFDGHCIKPDITLYSDKKPSNENKCRARDMETFIEVKYEEKHDGFDDDIEELEKLAGEPRDTRGQLVTYLNAMQASQYRTHGFGVVIAAQRCHLLRHTHSGIEVTTRFNYTTSPYLATFLWRLSHASPAVRGIDDTFEPATSDKASAILNAVGKPLWKVRVKDRYYYVSAEFTRNHHYPVGRGTRCFVAVDCETWQKCVLKDTWRKHSPILAEADVPGATHSCGVLGPEWHFPKSSRTVRQHQHYRIVLGVVGEPMTVFQSTWELNNVVLHALQSHHDAVGKAKVDHRDVSVGNIIIVRHGYSQPATGMLIDWELSKYHEENEARVYEKTGTLQFTAARLLEEQPEIRTFADDLESFLLVYLWCAARYAPNKMTPHFRSMILRQFDSQDSSARKAMLLAGRATAYQYGLSSLYLYQILRDILDHYKFRYYIPSGDPEEDEKAQRIKDEIEKHDWMENALMDQEIELGKKDEPSSRKRKAMVSEYTAVSERRMKQRGERGPIPQEEDNDSDGM
ncbi:hypothetical protein BDP27DRAFT_1423393 [Rhodocollybia butyracea]|uniref:Fungal-type protein kinase domain-containing protein n=1 Tax=Rhodocollybia butyracea TaxID=206335 RepID=A0A9P5PS35_9AGAR|nr:hypothetical protein BDP27DRAFT_1423393 [Rhodocollybia butyracea]